ncbi:potassium channel family protein [Streptomyces sp. NBC_00285]|uniref:potassium channel family protein n=1 Tax=Streptomyces sp. NBC_00285 TaxID=2975700 RepID=UPI003251A7AB
MAFLAGYALRVLADGLADGLLDLCLAVTLAAWALFAVDYAVRRRLSGQRQRFVRTHVLDTLVLLLPLLRPLRVVKVYEAVQRRRGRPRLALHARVSVYAGLSTLLLGFTGALAVYQQERHAPGTTMHTFGDAVWWTCATLATVGYGDVVPVTPLGRLIAVGVMMIGLALLGAVTGRTTKGPRGTELPEGPTCRRQTCVRSSTTFAIFAMASSNGMPFSCEPSR